ncbi:MAG: TlpA disulfide reductase family protein [Cyclobacteriaceae bacterium]
MNRKHLNFTLAVCLAGMLFACRPMQDLADGRWSGFFTVETDSIPFQFDVSHINGRVAVQLVNGEEHAPLDSAYWQNDSLRINIDLYDSYLIGKASDGQFIGQLRRNYEGSKPLSFQAAHQPDRFTVRDTTELTHAAGTWSVLLTSARDSSKRYTVGVFHQKGHLVTGTLLTTTGDYRYLDGVVDGNELKLSVFGGSSPMLLKGTLKGESLEGQFISPFGKTWLSAVRSDTAHLPDPYSLTYLKKGTEQLDFTFPDLQGNPVSLKDPKYQGKVVIVTIMGNWCPNCIDEAGLLAPWYTRNKDRGVEIIGLTFERKDDLAYARARVAPLIRRFGITYDILIAGIANKTSASEKLPAVNAVLAFPTTFFIDRSGKVRKIHTGYTGPASGELYDEFVREFNDLTDQLLAESPGGTAAQ